jgi:hypothetical protein
MTTAPDGTYIATLTPEPDGRVGIYIDDGGAGFIFHNLRVAPDVELVGDTSRSPASITVVQGVVTRIDVLHRRWDLDTTGQRMRSSTRCQG